MRKLAILILLILFLSLVFSSYIKAQNAAAYNINIITSNFFKFMRVNKFTNASELFHYPNDYSSEELIKEKSDVIGTLKLLKKEFGNVLQLKISRSSDKVIGYGVSGANIEYWQKHPEFTFQIFKVNFKKEGQGFIRISYCAIINKWEIQGVEYGLPESEYTKYKISEIIKKREQQLKKAR